MTKRTRTLLLSVVFTAAFLARYYLIRFYSHIIPDDAYYYLTVAFNFITGKGITLDTLGPTNGFHPLWMFFLSPVFFISTGNPILPIKLSLLMCALLFLASSLYFYKISNLIVKNRTISLFLVCLYVLNPGGIFLSIVGMETSLTVLLTLAFGYHFMRERERHFPSVKQNVWIGFLGGFLILSRTDTALLFVIALGLMFLDKVREKSFRPLFLVPVTAALVTLPWLLWNFLTFGSIVQVSGKAKPYVLHKLFLLSHGTYFTTATLRLLARQSIDVLTMTMQYTGLGLIAPAAVLAVLLLAPKRASVRKSLLKLDFFILYTLIYVIVHSLIRWNFRAYYVGAYLPLFYFFIGILLVRALSRARNTRRFWAIAGISAFLVMGYNAVMLCRDELALSGGSGHNISGTMDALRESPRLEVETPTPLLDYVRALRGEFALCEADIRRLAHLDEIEANLPETKPEKDPKDIRIGFTDCGRLAYFTRFYDLCKVINLDGAMNTDAYEAIRDGRLMDYIVRMDIDQVRLAKRNLREEFLGKGFEAYLRPVGLRKDFRYMVKREPDREMQERSGITKECAAETGYSTHPLSTVTAEDRMEGQLYATTDSTRKSEVPGRWHGFQTHRFDQGLSEGQREKIEELEAIGYATGSVAGGDLKEVTIHVRARAYPGVNLYASGHAPEAFLMDMEGKIMHAWRCDFRDVWPDYPVEKNVEATMYFRRVHLFPNGDLLAIYDGLGIVKLDRDSRIIWANPCRAHHDLQVMPSGEIHTLTREARIIPDLDPERPIQEDYATILSPDGEVMRSISLIDCFRNSDRFREILEKRVRRHGDIFHTNTVSILDGSISENIGAFKRGNLLTSMRFLDTIAVVDLEREEVVWAYRGNFHRQHDPHVIGTGHLLLFNNRSDREHSTVQEYDPVTMSLVWEYPGTEDDPLYSKSCGAAQRLPNGNTLITESDNGRALEVTPEKDIVWEFYNPARAGDHHEFIATLFEMQRLDPDFPLQWVPGSDE